MFKLFRRDGSTGAKEPAPAGASAAGAGPTRDEIEKACAAADDRDPMAIVVRILRGPAVRLAGPEQHFLVAAALLAAWSNARGEQGARAARVAEARRRSEPAGAAAGAKGPSPAAVGAGTFVAIAAGCSSDPAQAHDLAHRMTARATAVVGGDSGRCERRDAKLSTLAAVRFVQDNLDLELPSRGPSCEWSTQNRACVGAACPFNR